MSDWYTVHVEALNCVDRDMGIKYFRKSKVPGSYLIPTLNELYNMHTINISFHFNSFYIYKYLVYTKSIPIFFIMKM